MNSRMIFGVKCCFTTTSNLRYDVCSFTANKASFRRTINRFVAEKYARVNSILWRSYIVKISVTKLSELSTFVVAIANL